MTKLGKGQTGYFAEDWCELSDFVSLVSKGMAEAEAPQADRIEHSIPIYEMGRLGSELDHPDRRRALMAEWAHVLRTGPGVLVLKGAYEDTSIIDDATRAYQAIIADEKARAAGGADHFAAAGANDRVWNALQKLCFHAPEVYLRYFANTAIEAACEAWLGPGYQMTAQINLVHPGGRAQQAHRDYHLGFQTAGRSADYPAHVHDLSPALTLQGAVAHCDMPVESGPTKLLPFSQLYRPGYVAWRRPDFRQYFEAAYVQLPLEKGDALFFSPALFHAAGDNDTADISRMANLLQVSSAFGRAMESVDRREMCASLYPHAVTAWADGTLGAADLRAAIAATAEGYSFPTNLETDPPSDGLSPETQQELFWRAISEGMNAAEFRLALAAQHSRQQP